MAEALWIGLLGGFGLMGKAWKSDKPIWFVVGILLAFWTAVTLIFYYVLTD